MAPQLESFRPVPQGSPHRGSGRTDEARVGGPMSLGRDLLGSVERSAVERSSSPGNGARTRYTFMCPASKWDNAIRLGERNRGTREALIVTGVRERARARFPQAPARLRPFAPCAMQNRSGTVPIQPTCRLRGRAPVVRGVPGAAR
jgi:hypothetical protein